MRITPALARFAPALSGFLFLGLAACNSQPQNIVVGPQDDMKAALAKAKPVQLPPSMVASKSYRCDDNSVVYVDWFGDNKSANLRTKKGGTPTMVKSDTAGGDMTADGGYSVSGSASASTIKVATPGKKAQSCTA